MEPDSARPSRGPDSEAPPHASSDTPYEAFSDDELEALEALAAFEAEHRRILAMQTLFYRRRKGGVA
jgi:hypothetical protein